MATVYVHYVNSSENGETRSLNEFNNDFRSITPSNVHIKNINQRGQGFFVDYLSDESANYIFKPEVENYLASKNLSASLVFDLAHLREIFMVNVPDEIFNKSPEAILTEIQTLYSTIIHVKHINSNSSGRKYLILTADSKNREIN